MRNLVKSHIMIQPDWKKSQDRVADADIIIANKAPLNESTIKDAKNLKLICETATGYNNVDIEYCKAKGIRVTNAVGYSTPIVAQHTLHWHCICWRSCRYFDQYVKSGGYGRRLCSPLPNHTSQNWKVRPGVLSDLVILAER